MGFAWHKLYSIVVTETGEIICIENPYECDGTPTSGVVCYNTGYGAGGTTAGDGISVGVITGDNQTICITVTGNACDFYGDEDNNPYSYGRILPTDFSYQQTGQWWVVQGLTSAAGGPLSNVYGNMNQYPWCPIDIRFECPMNCWRPNEAGYSGGNFCYTDLQTSNGGVPFYLRSPSSPTSIPGYINNQRISMMWTERLRFPTSQAITAGASQEFLDNGSNYRSKQVRILVVSGYNREHFMGPFVLTGGLGCPGNGKTAYNQGIDPNFLNFGGRPNLKTARNTIVWGSTTGSGWHASQYDATEFVRGVSGIRDMELSLGRDFPLSHEVMAYPLFGGWNMVNYSPTGDIVSSGGDNGSEPIECSGGVGYGCLQSRCRRCNYPPDPWTGIGHYTPYMSYAAAFSDAVPTPLLGYGGCTGNGLTQPYPICPGHTSTHDKNGQGIGPFSFACFNAHSYFNSTGVGDWYYHESPDVGNQGIPVCSVWSLLHAIYYRVHADLTSNIGITSAPVHIHRNITPDSWKNLDPSALTGPSGNFQMVRYVMERFADAVKNQGLPRDISDLAGGASASTGGFVESGQFSGYHLGGIKGPNWNFIYPNVFLWDRDNYLNASTTDKWKHIYTIGNSNIIYDSQVNRDLIQSNGSSYTGDTYRAIFEIDECSHQAFPGGTHNARFIGFGSADSGVTAGPAQIAIAALPRMITCGTGSNENNYWESLCSYWSSFCDVDRQGGVCNVVYGSPAQYNWAYDQQACDECNRWASNCPGWYVTRGNFLRTTWNPGSGAITITTVYDGCGLTNL